MHVLLIADMEGAAGIIDHRECWPVFPHYWRTGRQHLTADVAAAATGLFAGGATAVTVADTHGKDIWPNLQRDVLPTRVDIAQYESWDEWQQAGYDAAFHLGFHARCGTPAFMSHTHTTNIRIAVDGTSITENHHCAWTAAIPVLGVTGDAALAPQLSGSLAGTPFLATKHSTGRPTALRLYPDAPSSGEALHQFAAHAVQRWRERRAPELPASFTLSVSLDPSLAAYAAGEHGWQHTRPAVLTVEVADWHREARPALASALAAASRVWEPHDPVFEIGSEKAMRTQDPARLAGAREFLNMWMHAEEADWLV